MCYSGKCPYEDLKGECTGYPGKCYFDALDEAYNSLYSYKFEKEYKESYEYLYNYYLKEEDLNPEKAHVLADKEAREEAEAIAEMYAEENCKDEALGLLEG